MYDLVHKHKRVAQFILALIMIPFAFFGVDYYFRSGGGPGDVARSAAARSAKLGASPESQGRVSARWLI